MTLAGIGFMPNPFWPGPLLPVTETRTMTSTARTTRTVPKMAAVMAVERFGARPAFPRREAGPPARARCAAAAWALVRGVDGGAERARCEAVLAFWPEVFRWARRSRARSAADVVGPAGLSAGTCPAVGPHLSWAGSGGDGCHSVPLRHALLVGTATGAADGASSAEDSTCHFGPDQFGSVVAPASLLSARRRLGHAWAVIGALVVELHFPACRSLKEKRAVLRPIIDGSRARFGVAVAETAFQELHQRSVVEVAAAAASERVVTETLDAVERFIWSLPGLEVTGAARRWLEDD